MTSAGTTAGGTVTWLFIAMEASNSALEDPSTKLEKRGSSHSVKSSGWHGRSALAIQAEAIERSTLEPPFELTVALRDTKDAALGSFAEGWKEPGHGMYDMVTCIEDHVLLRWELDQQPVAEDIALELGDRIEHAFGTSHRRHLAHRGQYEGRFDPRFGF